MKTLIKDAAVVRPDGTTAQASIAVDGTRIAAVGAVPGGFAADEIIDGKDMLAVPGFVNAHTHASMTLLRSYADDMELMEWLNNHIWPVEAKMVSDDIYWGAALAAVEMIKSGTTTFADMYGPFMERVADVAAQSGMRGVLSRGIIGVAPDGEKKIEENVTLYKDYHGAADGRIRIDFSIHAEREAVRQASVCLCGGNGALRERHARRALRPSRRRRDRHHEEAPYPRRA